jgi:hypothetical protein
MGLTPEPNVIVHPCPGHQVIASCDLPLGSHSRMRVPAGSTGEIVATPAFFSTSYSIQFRVHGTEVTVHGVKRHDFRILEGSSAIPPGFPPAKRYPQPPRVAPHQQAQENA